MGHILVLSGAGRYADNIHDFDATSEAVSQVLTERSCSYWAGSARR